MWCCVDYYCGSCSTRSAEYRQLYALSVDTGLMIVSRRSHFTKTWIQAHLTLRNVKIYIYYV